MSESKSGVQEFLKRRNPAWNLVGRVHFNVAENRKDPDAPFAFLATYTTRLSAQAKAQHLPLGQALREYAGAANKDRLLSLLLPVQRASETCPWLKTMVDAGEIFHPLRWTPREALQLLRDVPQLETAGVVVRMPAAWRGSRPPRPHVTGTVGTKAPSGLGQNALLDFRMDVTLDGEPLTAAEIRDLLAKTDGLALVRGRWVEIDREHLQSMIERFGEVERTAKQNGLAFGEAMRLLAGADVAGSADDTGAAADADWAQVVAGPWLAETLKGLRTSAGLGADRSRRRAARRAAALPAGGRALALSADETRSRRVSGRRHGTRQDHPGALAAAGSEAPAQRSAAAEPAGGAGIAAGQLGVGDRTLRAGVEGAGRASVGPAGGRIEGS